MNFRIAALAIAIVPILSVSLPVPSFAAADRAVAALLTRDQRAVDELAISLQDDPGVKAYRAQVREQWTKLPQYDLRGGPETLDGALDEMIFVALRAVAAHNPAKPAVIWTSQGPYAFGGLAVPSSRLTGDNPDRIYRNIAVSPTYRYEIRGQVQREAGNGEFSFAASPSLSMGGRPKATLNSRAIDVAPDGSFTILADASPTEGRRNHLHLPPGTHSILVRDTLADWSGQLPNHLVVRRLDNAPATPRSDQQIREEARAEVVRFIAQSTPYIGLGWQRPPNLLQANLRGSNTGVNASISSVSRFSLGEKQALVITVAQSGAKYLGIQLTDPWFRSFDHADRTSSLSHRQASPNADGTITFVIAAQDPGYYNWLDTTGFREGLVMLRVEDFEGPLPAADAVIKQVRLVELSDLPAAVPGQFRRVDAAGRARQILERKSGFDRRLVVSEPEITARRQ